MHFSSYAVTAFVGAAVATLSAQAQSKFTYGTASGTYAGVISQEANGATNPKAPSLGTPINQTSFARLVSVNSVDDWCTFSSPDGQPIADEEAVTVAFCTQARNNARVIVSKFCLFNKFLAAALANTIPHLARWNPHGCSLCQDTIVRSNHGSW